MSESCRICGIESDNNICDDCNDYCDEVENELDYDEYVANQDVSPEQLAGEIFEDKLSAYRNEY